MKIYSEIVQQIQSIFIYIKYVNILSENDSEVLGRNFHAIKCKINKEIFDLYVTE